MTAADARTLTDQARKPDDGLARLWLDSWHKLIAKTARAGLSKATEDQLDPPRTPIPRASRETALDRLRAEGYDVQPVRWRGGESQIEVSW